MTTGDGVGRQADGVAANQRVPARGDRLSAVHPTALHTHARAASQCGCTSPGRSAPRKRLTHWRRAHRGPHLRPHCATAPARRRRRSNRSSSLLSFALGQRLARARQPGRARRRPRRGACCCRAGQPPRQLLGPPGDALARQRLGRGEALRVLLRLRLRRFSLSRSCSLSSSRVCRWGGRHAPRGVGLPIRLRRGRGRGLRGFCGGLGGRRREATRRRRRRGCRRPGAVGAAAARCVRLGHCTDGGGACGPPKVAWDARTVASGQPRADGERGRLHRVPFSARPNVAAAVAAATRGALLEEQDGNQETGEVTTREVPPGLPTGEGKPRQRLRVRRLVGLIAGVAWRREEYRERLTQASTHSRCPRAKTREEHAKAHPHHHAWGSARTSSCERVARGAGRHNSIQLSLPSCNSTAALFHRDIKRRCTA